MLFKNLYSFGDKLEDKIRGKLSHYPIIYAFIGGTGIIIFWRGVWHSMDYTMEILVSAEHSLNLVWWDGPLSILIGIILLLASGLFVTSFIGNEIIISGLNKEKKLVEKTEEELKIELKENDSIKQEIHEMDKRLKRIEEGLKK